MKDQGGLADCLFDPSDAFGADPGVQALRRIFGALEKAQAQMMAGLGVNPFDQRLRPCRRRARAVFNAKWNEYAASGRELAPAQAAGVYCQALALSISRQGLLTKEAGERLDQVTQSVLKGLTP